MLPTVNKTASEFEKTQGMAAKYGVHAMEILINDLVKAGANKARIKAKVFGGGKVVPSFVQARCWEVQRRIRNRLFKHGRHTDIGQ